MCACVCVCVKGAVPVLPSAGGWGRKEEVPAVRQAPYTCHFIQSSQPSLGSLFLPFTRAVIAGLAACLLD